MTIRQLVFLADVVELLDTGKSNEEDIKEVREEDISLLSKVLPSKAPGLGLML